MIEKENVKVREQREPAARTSNEKVKEKGKPKSSFHSEQLLLRSKKTTDIP